VLLDRHVQIVGAAVMQKKDALADAPKRRAAELPSSCAALRDSIGKCRAHIMERKITERLESHIALRRAQFGAAGGLINDVTRAASDV